MKYGRGLEANMDISGMYLAEHWTGTHWSRVDLYPSTLVCILRLLHMVVKHAL